MLVLAYKMEVKIQHGTCMEPTIPVRLEHDSDACKLDGGVFKSHHTGRQQEFCSIPQSHTML